RFVDRARAIGAYDGVLRAVVHALKYEGRRSLGPRVSGLMRQRGGDILEGAACAIPVPLHPSRRRHRGFNQAVDLARHVGIEAGAGRRGRGPATAPAARTPALPPGQPHRNVRDAFAIPRAPAPLAGATVVLIDDVSTTGATLEA